MKRILMATLTLYLLLTPIAYSQEYATRSRLLMGTFIEVTASDNNAFDIVFNEISRIEKLLSKYRSDSEISKLNKNGKLKVSQDTLKIIMWAKKMFVESNGAFDITVAPAVDLWRKAIKENKLPDAREVIKTKQFIDSNKIAIKEESSEVSFLTDGIEIDLGAIAKGYAVDCAIRKLKASGIKSCLINAGGDIYCLGKRGNRPWKIGIRNPRNPTDISEILELTDTAVATSGDYEQYFIVDNHRYSHIINPKTARPAQSGVISVTVIAPDCLTADALATTIFVLGKVAGQKLADRFKNTKVFIITEEEMNAKTN
jgi:thiamine biosynthesis lipoprotein